MDSTFTAFFEATTLGNFESKTTRDHYVASVRIGSEVRKADVPNDTNFRFGTIGSKLTQINHCAAGYLVGEQEPSHRNIGNFSRPGDAFVGQRYLALRVIFGTTGFASTSDRLKIYA